VCVCVCDARADVVLNLGLNFFNKAALGRSTALHFSFPLFYTACHQFSSFCCMSLIFWLVPSTNTLSYATFEAKRGWILLLGVLFVLNIACNNASLVYIGVSINAIIKSITPLPAMILSFALERKRYPMGKVASVVGMCAAAVISVPFGDDSTASPFGLLLVTISMLAAATRPVMAAMLMGDAKQTGLTPLVLVWYDSLISFTVLVVISLATELDGLILYFSAQPLRGLGIVILGSTMAFCYNIVTFSLTKAVGSLTTAVLGNVKQARAPLPPPPPQRNTPHIAALPRPPCQPLCTPPLLTPPFRCDCIGCSPFPSPACRAILTTFPSCTTSPSPLAPLATLPGSPDNHLRLCTRPPRSPRLNHRHHPLLSLLRYVHIPRRR
jgi:drug/metabolite transporter (DMT)-like permease